MVYQIGAMNLLTLYCDALLSVVNLLFNFGLICSVPTQDSLPILLEQTDKGGRESRTSDSSFKRHTCTSLFVRPKKTIEFISLNKIY